MSSYSNNSIFWVETSKIHPNPFQPRRAFEPHTLEDLADSIRQYGVLQPLVVTRKEEYQPDGGMEVSYELIAGERRLRASKLAGLEQVPVLIRKETDNKVKLELAIIENLQREDLNPIDRALAFEQLHKEFELTHADIGKRMGKSRVYVSNSLRLLSLPDDIKQSLMAGKITEGHTRPLLMLSDRPEEQSTLFKEIVIKNMSVRDAEKIARKVAHDKVRKKEFEVDPKIRVYEKQMSENLGTRVQIEPKEKGGKIVIDYFTLKDLETIIDAMKKTGNSDSTKMMMDYLGDRLREQEELTNTTAVEFPPRYEEEPSEDEQSSPLISEDEVITVEEEVTIPQEPEPTLEENYEVPQEVPVSEQEPIRREENHNNQYQQEPPQQPPYYPPQHHHTSVPPQYDTYRYQEQPVVQKPKKKGFFGRLFG